MTYTAILIITRNSNLTSEEFRDYYEHKHIPLIYSLMGACWPKSFKRRYLARINRKGFGGPANPDHPPLTLKGEMQGLDCDCIAEMSFASEEVFQDFYEKRHEKDIAAIVSEDESVFLEPGKTTIVVIGETWSTDQNGVTTSEVNYVSKGDRVDGGESPSEGSYVSLLNL